MKRAALIAGALLGAVILGCRAHPGAESRATSVTPRADAVFTSTRSVTGLLALPDGTVWVGTTGGLLRRSSSGQWRKWTRLDGLPSQEVRHLAWDGQTVSARFPAASARWDGGQWREEQTVPSAETPPAAETPPSAARTCSSVVWRGTPCAASLAGLEIGDASHARQIPLPPSAGTHISALLPQGDALWAALYGDGLWSWDGEHWQSVLPGLPPEAREITALASNGQGVWAGTRRAGVWVHDARGWSRAPMPADEPFDHNIEALAVYDGHLYASTLEDGLIVRSPQGWSHIGPPALSSDAPRQMAVFQGRLYVRHGGGQVDRFDGARWVRNIFAWLPRRPVSALATDGARLYVAQWGGWSETDGKRWTHHLTLPALQGLAITALLPDGPTLWLGTQGRGLAEVTPATDAVRWHDERDGLPDDWVTCLARVSGMLYAGTFTGGLACWDGRKWTQPPELTHQNVTSLAPDGAGGLWVATRTGGLHRDARGAWAVLRRGRAFPDTEQQALAAVPGGVWIGTRTGLDFYRAR